MKQFEKMKKFELNSTTWNSKDLPVLLCQIHLIKSVSSVSQSCLTLCNSMDCSIPGFPVCHHLPELAQTHTHWVYDAIQPSHPLLSPFFPAFKISQYQGPFQWLRSSHRWPKYWSFSISPSNEYSGKIFFLFSSVQFSSSVMSDSLWPHESQHARPPCPSPTPRVHSNSRPSHQWCHRV